MMLNVILATLIVGAVSFIGVLVVYSKKRKPRFLKAMISLAAGSLLAAALLDLLPEAIEQSNFEPRTITGIVLLSIVIFFVLERLIHWHHCRCEEHGIAKSEEKRHLVVINLTGDAIHNLIDGFLIASAFMIDAKLGLVVTVAVILHEIPQEISDFGVLLYAGLGKGKALLYNFLVALTSVAGAIFFFFIGSKFEFLIPVMAAFAAGNFIYLAAADLIPELHHETKTGRIVVNSIWLIVGVLIIYLTGFIFPHV